MAAVAELQEALAVLAVLAVGAQRSPTCRTHCKPPAAVAAVAGAIITLAMEVPAVLVALAKTEQVVAEI